MMDASNLLDLFDDEDDTSTGSESSEDDEVYMSDIVALAQECTVRRKRAKVQMYAESVVTEYYDDKFIQTFRISRSECEYLTARLEASEFYSGPPIQGGGRTAISPTKYLYVYLYFVGHEGSCFRQVGDLFDMTESSVEKIFNRVISFLCSLRSEYIVWPKTARKEESADTFQKIAGFENIIGCIDGTHFRIDSPGQDDKMAFYNRKHYFSVQMQGVCNENRKFIDIFVGYPGSVHDARVYRNSDVGKQMADICRGYHILGDSAYPLSSVLLTPFKDNGHLTACEKHYNTLLSSTRITIEHTFGILRKRFPYLFHVKLRNIEWIVKLITSVCVVHNLGNDRDTDCMDDVDSDDDMDDSSDDDDEPQANMSSRRQYVQAAQARMEIAKKLWVGTGRRMP